MPDTLTETAPADHLLADYRPGAAFFFAAPDRTLLATGRRTRVTGAGAELAARVSRVLRDAHAAGHPAALVVGAVPFDTGRDASLVVPEDVRWGRPLGLADPRPGTGPALTDYTVRPVPEPTGYADGVREALTRLAGDELDKVVLARTVELTAAAPVDVRAALTNLTTHDPGGYLFAVDLPGTDRPTLLGASPELLVSRRGRRVVANPLAGSAARCADPTEDWQRAADLLASVKNRREHAVVAAAVADRLAPLCRDLSVPAEPVIAGTATMWHLSTRVSGTLVDPAVSALDLALALHPTPAVCGVPTAAARAAIGEIEPFDRGFYAGMVGWCDRRGDGEWVVAIRCGEFAGRRLRLFAGAGIVSGSDPADELAETTAKFRTLSAALGLDGVA